jgi:hypothetical protein
MIKSGSPPGARALFKSAARSDDLACDPATIRSGKKRDQTSGIFRLAKAPESKSA